MRASPTPQPAVICRQLLAALGASEGRRKRRKRDTTPDAIGLAIKRRLLREAAAADPEPGEFEGWLLGRALAAAEPEAGEPSGAVLAVAREILAEWKLAASSEAFRAWLDEGAPSEDALGESPEQKRH